MPLTKSPLRYPGGKSVLAPLLKDVLVANELQGGVYLEPFAGGAGAALDLLFNEYVDEIIINDADYCIYAFWKSILDQTDRFLRFLDSRPVTIDEWHRQKRVYANPQNHSLLKVGFATFFLNRCNRSGILKNAGPIGGYNQTGDYPIDARFNKIDLRQRIERISEYDGRVSVYNLDATELLSQAETLTDNDRLFVYLDPPYYDKGAELYLNHFQHDDHLNLANFIQGARGFKWLVSYDNTEQIKSMYADMNVVEFDLKYSLNENKQGRELLIYNDDIRVPHRSFFLSRTGS